MTTDNYNHRDSNLRKALAHREQLLPELPADLNERLMRRVADKPHRNRRIVWPWVAAACIAGVISIVLMPPKESTTGVASSVECVASNTDANTEEDKHTDTPKVTTENIPVTTKRKVTYHAQQVAVVSKPQPKDDTAEVTPTAASEQAPLEYITADGNKIILATNPERLKYTPEEIEKLKERVRQKYIELLQEETEIFESTQEQLSAMNEEMKN